MFTLELPAFGTLGADKCAFETSNIYYWSKSFWLFCGLGWSCIVLSLLRATQCGVASKRPEYTSVLKCMKSAKVLQVKFGKPLICQFVPLSPLHCWLLESRRVQLLLNPLLSEYKVRIVHIFWINFANLTTKLTWKLWKACELFTEWLYTILGRKYWE